jgi:hypothetical protein
MVHITLAGPQKKRPTRTIRTTSGKICLSWIADRKPDSEATPMKKSKRPAARRDSQNRPTSLKPPSRNDVIKIGRNGQKRQELLPGRKPWQLCCEPSSSSKPLSNTACISPSWAILTGVTCRRASHLGAISELARPSGCLAGILSRGRRAEPPRHRFPLYQAGRGCMSVRARGPPVGGRLH